MGETVVVGATVGAFVLNHDHDFARPNATIAGGQLLGRFVGSPLQLTVASGFQRMEDLFNVPETDALYDGERFQMDYSLLWSSAQLAIDAGPLPVTAGLDHAINLANYAGLDEIEEVYRDQKQAVVASLTLGALEEKGDVLIGAWYAHKERYSVVDYLAEDDWVRWGNIHRNRNVNYRGVEGRLGYAFSRHIGLVARFYAVRGLATTGTHTETGHRFRLDLDVRAPGRR